MSDSASAEPTLGAIEWRRLDPRMLLVHPARELVRFFPLVLGAFFAGGGSGSDGVLWQLLGVGVPVALGVVRFLSTRFRVTETQVELQRGLLGRSVLRARLDRVRTVELTASPVHRLLGLARLEIGTGSAAAKQEERLALDALAAPEARQLRSALLRRSADPDRTELPARADRREGAGPAARPLLRLDPRWVRYAPFTASGAAAAGGLLALLGQYGYQGVARVVEGSGLRNQVSAASPVLFVGAVVVAFAVLATVLGVLGYLVTNWGFVLSRDVVGGTLHVQRGLLTSTETSMEVARIRGVEVVEPLPLRVAGGARTVAVVTGLDKDEAASRVVVPPAPRAVAYDVAGQVLGDGSALRTPLRQHGRAARRRRWTRALGGAALLPLLGAAASAYAGTTWWVVVPLLFALPLAALLAEDRYRRLGHTLTRHHVVLRSGTFLGRHVALQREGVIGWNLEQSWFQRRAGLVHLVATTAAGTQAYVARDIPEADAVRLAEETLPGLVRPFLCSTREHGPSRGHRRCARGEK